MGAILVVLMLTLANAAGEETALILVPGQHWAGTSQLPQDGWLALQEHGDSHELRAARVTTVPDPVDIERVEVDSVPPSAILLFRSIPGLAAGPITPVHPPARNITLYEPGKAVPLVLEGRTYTLTLEASDEQLADARVILSDGRRQQILFELEGTGDEPHFTALWAGDLDRDGLLDLVMTMSGKYSYHPRTLFVSSGATDGEIVREIAQSDDFSC